MTTIEEKISKRAHEFELGALLNLLGHCGYTPSDLLFRSYLSQASQPGFIHRVEFKEEPTRQVIIYLNMGLFSAFTTLPTYFFKMMDKDVIDEESFIGFMGYFDHVMMKNYFENIMVENNKALYRNFENTKRVLLQLLALNSVSCVHWLFDLTFPELTSWVGRTQQSGEVKMKGIVLGQSQLGDNSAFGSKAVIPTMGMDAYLYCDSEFNDRKRPWAEICRERLREVIFPVLSETSIWLRVFLLIRTQKGWAKLEQGSYLGVDKIRGGEDKGRKVLLFQGRPERD